MSDEAESLRLMFVAGEESGDAHAAALVRALRERAPYARFEFFGSTGARMREAGVESVVREDDLAITGLLEIARALPRFLAAYRALKRAAFKRRPDAVVLVDWAPLPQPTPPRPPRPRAGARPPPPARPAHHLLHQPAALGLALAPRPTGATRR